MPIFDWHCHLSPKEIYENRAPEDIAWLWLAGDHYKWRAMRSCGVPEKYIMGDASRAKKFMAWAKIMPYLLGNPLYHWTHLELQRYFDIYEPLSEKTAKDIWNRANAKIAAGGFTPRELIESSNVVPLHDRRRGGQPRISQAHRRGQSFKCRVIPAFRPDKALGIELPGYRDWVKALAKSFGRKKSTATKSSKKCS